MKKLFTILALVVLCCVACTSNENTELQKITFENTQWLDISATETTNSPEGCTINVIIDFDLYEKGCCVMAEVVAESTNTQYPVGACTILATMPYSVTYDEAGNVSTMKLGEELLYEVEDLGNGRVLMTDPTPDSGRQFILERIEKPWTLGE